MLRQSKGNMYDFVTHTWNPIKGKCPHDCSYCYMKRWGEQKPLRLDEKELRTELGSGNFIFVGSSTDMFAGDICGTWITTVLDYMKVFDNSYLLQSKNPYGFIEFKEDIPKDTVICTTIETNRFYGNIMNNSPDPADRALSMEKISLPKYVTIEPIMDFDLEQMVMYIKACQPVQVNIGADSGRNNLPEPSRDKLLALIDELKKFTTIHKKSNLERLMRA
jgi:DNA repair photolyase